MELQQKTDSGSGQTGSGRRTMNLRNVNDVSWDECPPAPDFGNLLRNYRAVRIRYLGNSMLKIGCSSTPLRGATPIWPWILSKKPTPVTMTFVAGTLVLNGAVPGFGGRPVDLP